MALEPLKEIVGFDWNRANAKKNWLKHGVSPGECEQVFFNRSFFSASDVKHSKREKRFYVLGVTDVGRRLFLVFALRRKLIRVISARDMSRKERKNYEQEIKTIKDSEV